MPATSIATTAGAEHASGGLPQFDFSWWAGEAIWTVAIFVVLFLLFSRVFVPRVGGTIDAREDRISGDIGAARALRDQADAQAAEAAAETAQARAAAHKMALDAKAKALDEAAKREALEEAKLGETLAKAEARITATRDAAMANVQAIASDAAAAIVGKLTGNPASADEVGAALAART